MPIRPYRAPFSTNVERVATALAHKRFEVESVVIEYSDRSKVIEVSWQGLVPVIVDEDGIRGRVVNDSHAILRYLEERDPDPPLFPRDSARRAELDVFLEWFDEAVSCTVLDCVRVADIRQDGVRNWASRRPPHCCFSGT
jgi:glutathione S-transferase